MTTLESNRCYACGKLFCCADCCTEHIKKKHPGRESKCPLCRSEHLMVKNFENQELLCHVVFHHLPLRCRLCGDNFKSCEDLRFIGSCSRHRLNRVTSAIQSEASKSQQSPETPSPLNKTPCGLLGTKRKEFSIESDYNGNFGSFTSPPELSRNTSTPMHVNLAGHANFAFKTPRSPIFSFKTPKAPGLSAKNARRNERLDIKENTPQNETISKDSDTSSSDSIYCSVSSLSKSAIGDYRTPLRSILCNQSAIPESSQQETSRTADRKLGTMQEISEEMGIEKVDVVDMDLTDVMCNIVSEDCSAVVPYKNASLRRAKEQRDSVKRVRFSDQFEVKSDAGVTSCSELNGSEVEEFFEARQSISEMSVAIVDKLSTSAALINRENEENLEKEESERDVVQRSPEIADSNTENLPQVSSTSSSSSRVVMMVVVEKSGSINTTDLAPIIDSSLKKLENVTGSGSPQGNSRVLPAQVDQHGNSATRVVSVDSYMSVSTVERYSTPNSTANDPQNPRDSLESSNSGTGGIFSAVAQAMRTAFRSFSGATSSKSTSRELVSATQNSALLPSDSNSSTSSSNVSTSLASALVPRSAKRSRDTEEISASQTSELVDPQNDMRSPVPKRHRGWYKIRAREPIARMRNNSLTSPRGVSSETQCFQQGSLSIGDTILPIPSRAHQSTQTD